MNPNWRTNYMRYRGVFLNLVSKYKKRDDVKVYLELLLSLATISVFAVFALRPTLLTISTLIREIDAKKETIQQMDSKIEDIQDAQRLYDRNRSNINLLTIAIPSTADPDIILRQIEGAVSQSSVGVRELKLGEMVIIRSAKTGQESANSNTSAAANEILFNISTTADYINLLGLVTVLENLRKPFDIKSANFTYKQDENEEVLTLTVEAGIPIVDR